MAKIKTVIVMTSDRSPRSRHTRKFASPWLATFVIAGLVTVPVPSLADDQGIVGSKLILIDQYSSGKAKVVFAAKDTAPGRIHNGMGDGDLSGRVLICPAAAPDNAGVYTLASPWLANTSSVSKYLNKLAAPGGVGAKVVVVKPASTVKMVAMNLGDGDSASGDDSTTDLNLNDPPGTCTVNVGDTMAVEVELAGGVDSETHRMCAEFTVDSVKSISGGTGCKVISKTSRAGTCGVCMRPPTPTPTPTQTPTPTPTPVLCGAEFGFFCLCGVSPSDPTGTCNIQASSCPIPNPISGITTCEVARDRCIDDCTTFFDGPGDCPTAPCFDCATGSTCVDAAQD